MVMINFTFIFTYVKSGYLKGGGSRLSTLGYAPYPLNLIPRSPKNVVALKAVGRQKIQA